jgi:chorismate mutase/prephenate dehydratase
VFLEVERARANYGVVPIENSTEGMVNHTLDLFVESDLKICSEILMPISHTLMSKTGSLAKVKAVYSHPQALGQCRIWLEGNLPGVKVVESASTAKAAQHAASDVKAAAIAPDLAAKMYHLRPIARHIEDMQDNYTRFLVIGRTNAERTGTDKTSLMVSIKDKVGALFALLKPFEKRGLNLTSIESRPSRKKAWDYYFFIDFLGHVSDPLVQEAIQEIENASLTVKVLGSYPRSEN